MPGDHIRPSISAIAEPFRHAPDPAARLEISVTHAAHPLPKRYIEVAPKDTGHTDTDAILTRLAVPSEQSGPPGGGRALVVASEAGRPPASHPSLESAAGGGGGAGGHALLVAHPIRLSTALGRLLAETERGKYHGPKRRGPMARLDGVSSGDKVCPSRGRGGVDVVVDGT
ncbi:hypothetical protein GGTG_14009 [Gaeumannomyces tritici R3-111a-1]|uniref:Uncharacterized protein n=1 Tax=Gaeumannomyces tritici (strain R3-111a-1) TaxID=644352 RepID=J3PKF4_GAET3|nr:hypothetical protein GGTG_14009 [Gaeumannomyces tritici R3-111a-1]EJT68414.1 hypothetical protein GGTG_14009 [Gaeumannomyces tritici R3-111a-1]